MSRCRHLCWFAAVIVVLLLWHPVDAHADTLIVIDAADTLGSAGTVVPISIFIQNLTDSVAGFSISITLSRPDLIIFTTDTLIDTCFACVDSACTVIDTNLCTLEVVPMTTAGSLVANWDYVEARTLGGTNIRLTGIADVDFDRSPLPILPFTNGLLLKVQGQVFCNISDSLPPSDRTVVLTVNPIGTIFTDPRGDTIADLKLINGSLTVPFTLKGDLDHNSIFDVLDIVRIVNTAFRGGASPCPPGVDDLNCDGVVSVLDVVALVGFVFRGGPQPFC